MKRKVFAVFIIVIMGCSCLHVPEKKVELENKIKFTGVAKQSVKIPRKLGEILLGAVKISRNDSSDFYFCYHNVRVLKIDSSGNMLICDGEDYVEYAAGSKKMTALNEADELVRNNPVQKSNLPDPPGYTKNIGMYGNHKYKWNYYFDNESRSNFSFVSDEDTGQKGETRYIIITSNFAGHDCEGAVVFIVNGFERNGMIGEDGNLYFCDGFDKDYIFIDKYILQDDKRAGNI